VDTDIDLFVREKATGTERPHSIPYENYYHPTSADTLGGSGVRTAGGVSMSSPPQRDLPPTPDEVPGTEEAATNECEGVRV